MSVRDETEQPIGYVVASSAARRPQRCTLAGRFVTLVPLDPAAHADALFEGSHGPDRERLWRYMFDGPFADLDAFGADLAKKAASEDPLFFAILDNASGQAVGRAALMRIEPAHRVIEVGNILYARALQRTPGATEAMYLLARHVFDDLGYRRYEWKTNDFNVASKHAAVRLGFSYEGVFRSHMIVKGRNRDTAWFSMLDSEWPARKCAFERWLAPANFEADGRHKIALSSLNGVGRP